MYKRQDLTSQLPTITTDLTINGPGARLLTIDAGNGADGVAGNQDGFRILELNDGVNGSSNRIEVNLSGVTLTGGDTSGNGGAIENIGEQLTLTGVEITGNTGNTGGGIDNFNGSLTVNDSSFSDNSSKASGVAGGGAIFSQGNLTVNNSTFSGNSAVLRGGAISVIQGGGNIISNSTIVGNSVGSAGGQVAANTGTSLTCLLYTSPSPRD